MYEKTRKPSNPRVSVDLPKSTTGTCASVAWVWGLLKSRPLQSLLFVSMCWNIFFLYVAFPVLSQTDEEFDFPLMSSSEYTKSPMASRLQNIASNVQHIVTNAIHSYNENEEEDSGNFYAEFGANSQSAEFPVTVSVADFVQHNFDSPLTARYSGHELTGRSVVQRRSLMQKSGFEFTISKEENTLWFDNHLFVFPEEKAAFCVMEKNSCSMFKQIMKRIRGKSDWKSTDYTSIHYLPYRGLMDISFRSPEATTSVMNKNKYYFAAFVRDPLERLVSGYADKCEKKRGVDLCNYARWGEQFRSRHGPPEKWKRAGVRTPSFQMWADGLLQCPCWPEVDKHFAPQYLFCNLWQYADRFDIFRFENRTHRKLWMERAGFWEKFGKSGWGDSSKKSIVEYGPKAHSSTGKQPGAVGQVDADSQGSHVNWDKDSRYIGYYAQNSTVTALLLDAYRSDYVTFGMQAAAWLCDPRIVKTQKLKGALRSLPRASRPPCIDQKWLWVAE